MAIPDFQTMMLPFLRLVGDGLEHTNSDMHAFLADHFNLSPDERSELLPSKGQTRFRNRVHWVKAHFKMAGLVESAGRAVCKITKRGLDILKSNPPKIDIHYLDQFEEYAARRKKASPVEIETKVDGDNAVPPEEAIADSVQSLRKQLVIELLDQIAKKPPAFFEKLVVELLVKMGYGGSVPEAERALVTGRTGDEGIDGVIKEDKLGLSAIYIQAKRWKGSVGSPEIDRFVGALDDKGSKGVFITTSDFSKDAWERAKRIREPKRVVLINGEKLADLMIDHDLGVSIKDTFVLKKIDFDYFSEEE